MLIELTYQELEQRCAELEAKLAETVVAAEADARAEFLRGQRSIASLPSVSV